MHSILLKTRINRGNSDRKIDLLLKDAYRKPQNPQVMKFPEKEGLNGVVAFTVIG